MDWDEAKSRPAPALAVGGDLSSVSIAELRARVSALQDEIARVEAEIDKKKRHEDLAASFFKK